MPDTQPVQLIEVHISMFDPTTSEPEVALSGSAIELRRLADGLREEGTIQIEASTGPSGLVAVAHDDDWTTPSGISRYSDTVETHLTMIDHFRFRLDIRSTAKETAELAESITTLLTEGPGAHLHHETYYVGGALCHKWASIVFDVVE